MPLFLATGLDVSALAQTRPYVFATYTYSTQTRLQNLEPLVRYLSEKTGHPIVASSYPTVKALIQAIAEDRVDFAMFTFERQLTL